MTYGKYGTADCSHRTVSDTTGERLLAGNDVESCARLTSDCCPRKALASKEAESQFQKIAGLTLSSVSSAWRSYWETCPEMESLCHSEIGTLPWFYTADLRRIKSYRAVWETCTSTMWQCVLARNCRGTVWHLGGLLQSFNQGKLGCSQLAFDASWLQHHLDNCHDAMSKGMRSRSVWQGH